MSRVAVARPAITAARNSAAVSTRRIRGPTSSVRQPAATARATSSSVNPPSGPTAKQNVTAGNRVSCRLAATIVPAEVARISGNALTKRHQTICDLPDVLASARMRQEAIRACSGAGDEIGPGLRLLDLQEAVAAALLRRLDHRPPQTHNRLLDRLGHAALGPQRHDPRHPQLDRFFDKPSLPIPLGQRYAERHRKRQFSIDVLAGNDRQFHLCPSHPLDNSRELITAAVEQRDPRAGGRPHDVDQMMRLRRRERHAIGRNRFLDKVTIGHGRNQGSGVRGQLFGDRLRFRTLGTPPVSSSVKFSCRFYRQEWIRGR